MPYKSLVGIPPKLNEPRTFIFAEQSMTLTDGWIVEDRLAKTFSDGFYSFRIIGVVFRPVINVAMMAGVLAWANVDCRIYP